MPAKLQPLASDALLPANDFSPAPEADTRPPLKIVGDSQEPPSRLPEPNLTTAPRDPLHAIKAMSEEEKIALCS